MLIFQAVSDKLAKCFMGYYLPHSVCEEYFDLGHMYTALNRYPGNAPINMGYRSLCFQFQSNNVFKVCNS